MQLQVDPNAVAEPIYIVFADLVNRSAIGIRNKYHTIASRAIISSPWQTSSHPWRPEPRAVAAKTAAIPHAASSIAAHRAQLCNRSNPHPISAQTAPASKARYGPPRTSARLRSPLGNIDADDGRKSTITPLMKK